MFWERRILDLKVVEHVARVTRSNHEAWMHEAPVTIRATRTQGISTLVASIRQGMSAAVVHAGERLQGTTVRHAADPSAL